jgi:hypothetical protein
MTIMTTYPGTPMYWRALKENLLVRGKDMRYEDWNAYTATMRTYHLSLRDVKLARSWARLETYVPLAWKQVRDGSPKQKARAIARLAPRVTVLGGLRLYAAWKLRQEEKANPALRAQSSGLPASIGQKTLADATPLSNGSPPSPAGGRTPSPVSQRGVPVAVLQAGDSGQ